MARDRPGHFNEDMSGLAAFRAALEPQEGQFMRGASYIMNAPKDLKWKPARSPNKVEPDMERIARCVQERNAQGRFTKHSDAKE